MRVSVILCTYSLEMYEHFIEAAESIFQQTYPAVELVIVVDGSESVYERVYEKYSDRENTTIHLNDENYGLLKSRNIGAELATGDIVAFIDDDAIADERWIEILVETYEKHDAMAVGGRMTPAWIAGKPAFLPEEFYWLVGVTHRGFADGEQEVRNTFGSNISFKRNVFLALGGFNTVIGGRQGEKNFQGGETELCARLKQEYGEGVWYNPDARVAHKVFSYRIELRWLLDRAFWQGYSKHAMETIVPASSRAEDLFLQRLLFEFAPQRFSQLLRQPSIPRLLQFIMLWVFTAVVGVGYLYGRVKW